MRISVVILTKNEEKNIEECIKSILWCDEIVIVDDNSEDKTREIAKRYKAKVYERALDGDFAKQRNFGLEKASGDWVLFVDSDERVSDALKQEIQSSIEVAGSDLSGFYLKREDTMWGKTLKHGEQGNTLLLRLAKKESGKWTGRVHEVWNIKGNTMVLHNVLEHFPHPTMSEFLSEINRYSTLRSQELFEKGVSSYWFSILLYTKAKFIQDYFVKLGFLDGIEGFIVAMLMSFHSFLVRGKLWQLSQK